MTQPIAERISATKTRIAALRAERGRATLAGTPFDDRVIDRANDELAALTDALPLEQARQDREHAQSVADHTRELRAELRAAEQARLAAHAAAESGASMFADAIQKIRDTSAIVARLHGALAMELPSMLSPLNTDLSLAKRLFGKLAKFYPGRNFGGVNFNVPLADPAESWVEAERAVGGILTK